MKAYDTLSETLEVLAYNGYILDFNLITRQTFNKQGSLPIDDFEIIHIFRFENNSDPADDAVLYVIISTKHQMKGTLVNGTGIYSDSLTNQFLDSINKQMDKT